MMQTFTKCLVALGLLSFGLPAAASAQTITGFTPAQAAPGATVTITGTKLNSLSSVMLNGQPVKVLSASDKQVEVQVPRAAATGRLRLTTNKGSVLTANKLGILRQSSAVSYLSKSTSVLGFNASGNYSTPMISDLNHDDRQELLVGQGDGTIMACEQTAVNAAGFGAGTLLKVQNGTTLATLNVGLNNAGGHFAKPTLTDLDGNGLLELLVGENTGTILRYEQVDATAANALVFTRTLLFANPYANTASPGDGYYARPTVADLDNNGLLDVLVGSNDGKLHRYEQTAANAITFNSLGFMKDEKGVVIDAGAVDKPLLTDYNGDGYLDMLLGNQAGAIVLYTQTGSDAVAFKSLGNLTTDGQKTLDMSGGGGFAAPAVTDIDGNGLLDLFVGNGNGSVYRLEQAQSATIPTIVAPLPVVLVAFGGQAQSSGNQLSWTTASEVNSAYFGLERSVDGVSFTQVAQVAALGSSASAHTYQYLDAAAPAGTSYYRLRQVDQGGTSTYSAVVALGRASAPSSAIGSARPQVFPTVFDETLSVALPDAVATQAATVTLLATDGRPVYASQLALGVAPQALPALPALAPGIYLLRIATAAGTSAQRVVRN
ncbi:MAG: FG-GAP-like repeat-containing protein [Janthinobacterium lividum]